MVLTGMANRRGRAASGVGQSPEGAERMLAGEGEGREEVWLSDDTDEREDIGGYSWLGGVKV